MRGYRRFLRGKLHRVTVTHADLDYEGSITIPAELLEAAGLLPGEAVAVWNVTNGNRFETYTIQGDRYSGLIGVNGAAAHLVSPGDIVIVAAFELVDDETIAQRVASGWSPRAVFVTADNQVREVRGEEAWRRAESFGGETRTGRTAS